MKTKLYSPPPLSGCRWWRIEWECCTYNVGGRGRLAWKSLLGTPFFCPFIYLCHSESALLITGMIIVICGQARVSLMISLRRVIISKPRSTVASGSRHLCTSQLSQWWKRQHLFSQKRAKEEGSLQLAQTRCHQGPGRPGSHAPGLVITFNRDSQYKAPWVQNR